MAAALLAQIWKAKPLVNNQVVGGESEREKSASSTSSLTEFNPVRTREKKTENLMNVAVGGQ